jgi:hypothetical protein
MYDELVKRLREATEKSVCGECGLNLCTGATKKGVLFAQAADAIEGLQRQIDAWVEPERKALIKSLPRWIPVTERLPDYPGRFMCYYEVNDREEIGHCIDWGRYDPDDGWYVSGVTHWMPLPEPPKEAD